MGLLVLGNHSLRGRGSTLTAIGDSPCRVWRCGSEESGRRESAVKRPQRLLSIIVALQSAGQTTAARLAEQFGVSARTILRDIEALIEADVPVAAEPGRYGGISLQVGTQIDVNRLSETEAEALALVGLDSRSARQLGLEEGMLRAFQRLDTRRSKPLGRADQHWVPLSEVVEIDSSGWFADEAAVDFADLVETLRSTRRLRVEYRSSGRAESRIYEVDPYGLYLRGGRWYLVGDVDSRPRMFAMSRLRGWTELDADRRTRPEATLQDVAGDLVDRLESRNDVIVTAYLDADREDLAHRILGSRLRSVEPLPTNDLKMRITVAYDQLDGVRQLMQFTDHIEVIDPPSARELVKKLAGDMAARH
ncbi:MAG: helix-turn-helix transcriptional regulator [Brevibacterium sp.]